MENSPQKLSLKSIKQFGKNIVNGFVYRTKLYFLPFTVSFKLINRNKEKLYFLMDKNNHYGFLIETIVLKLKLMRETWPDYKFSDIEKDNLDILISKGSELLEILEMEDAQNHLRSKEYLNKQKTFFDILSVKLPELFY